MQTIERKCACCGKLISFVISSTDNWAWKRTRKSRTKYYCSYGCMRRQEKQALC